MVGLFATLIYLAAVQVCVVFCLERAFYEALVHLQFLVKDEMLQSLNIGFQHGIKIMVIPFHPLEFGHIMRYKLVPLDIVKIMLEYLEENNV
jgi:hypothetical protein